MSTGPVLTGDALTLDKVKQYVWAFYIDETRPPVKIDEDAAIKLYESHYGKHPINEDEECFYYGILLYEAAFRDEKNRARYLTKAKEVFEIYRQTSGETEWDVIENRLADAVDFIKKEGLDKKVAAQQAKVTVPTIPGMVYVPAGAFLFGPDKTRKILPAEQAFYIDIEPVTNAVYKKFIEEAQYRKPTLWDERPDLAADDLPVTGVSWMDAVKFCHWAGKSLPTEEQWERAARGEDGRTYPWGEQKPTPELACYRQDDPEGGVGAGKLTPITGYEKNKSPFGCHVMVGHVWEWTSTHHEDDENSCLVKGGSWSDPNEPEFLSTWSRLPANKKEKSEVIGFRCTKAASKA